MYIHYIWRSLFFFYHKKNYRKLSFLAYSLNWSVFLFLIFILPSVRLTMLLHACWQYLRALRYLPNLTPAKSYAPPGTRIRKIDRSIAAPVTPNPKRNGHMCTTQHDHRCRSFQRFDTTKWPPYTYTWDVFKKKTNWRKKHGNPWKTLDLPWTIWTTENAIKKWNSKNEQTATMPTNMAGMGALASGVSGVPTAVPGGLQSASMAGIELGKKRMRDSNDDLLMVPRLMHEVHFFPFS